MPTAYPSAIDTFSNPIAGDALSSAVVPHAAQHANANDAIEAIETLLGANGANYVSVAGAQTITGAKTFSAVLTASDVLRAGDGTAARPSHSFASDTNTGMYSDAADILRFATAGTRRIQLDQFANLIIGDTDIVAGGGTGVVVIRNRTAAPTANQADGGILSVAAGALVWRGSAGTVTTIAPA